MPLVDGRGKMVQSRVEQNKTGRVNVKNVETTDGREIAKH
jgi:hypothetical protein